MICFLKQRTQVKWRAFNIDTRGRKKKLLSDSSKPLTKVLEVHKITVNGK